MLDLELTTLSLPLLLTSQSSGSVEMTHVDGRHRLREYGVFTRFLIFSPEPGLPSRDDSLTKNKQNIHSVIQEERRGRKRKYEILSNAMDGRIGRLQQNSPGNSLFGINPGN